MLVGLDNSKPYKAVYVPLPPPQFGAHLIEQFDKLWDCLVFIEKFQSEHYMCIWETPNGTIQFLEWKPPAEAATK
jgi:hypothetical protein